MQRMPYSTKQASNSAGITILRTASKHLQYASHAQELLLDRTVTCGSLLGCSNDLTLDVVAKQHDTGSEVCMREYQA